MRVENFRRCALSPRANQQSSFADSHAFMVDWSTP